MRVTTRMVTIITASVFCCLDGPAFSQDLESAREIMKRNFFVSKIDAIRTDSTMTLIDSDGAVRERKETAITKLLDNGIDLKVVEKFDKPADIKGTGVLQVQHENGDEDIWIYLPALGKSRRILASRKKDSFMGTDFSYSDVILPKVDIYQHRIVGAESLEGIKCYIVESIPTDEEVREVYGYSKKVTWVRKDNFLEKRIDYYGLEERLLKTQFISKERLINKARSRWIAMHREMVNHETGHRTVLNIDRLDVSTPVDDSIFTVRYLERE